MKAKNSLHFEDSLQLVGAKRRSRFSGAAGSFNYSARLCGEVSKAYFMVALLVALVVSPFFVGSAQQLKIEKPARNLYVIGHRGAAGLAPENTLASITRALEIGVDAVEFDVQLSTDGTVIVYHDFKLKPEITREANGEWLGSWKRPKIKDLTLAQLKKYDVGRLKPNTRYSLRYPDQQPVDGERIPTLKEVILLLKSGHSDKTQLWIEIKTSPEKPETSQSPEAVADAVVRVLRKEMVSARSKVLSFDWRALDHMQKVAPPIPTVYLSHTGTRLNNIKPGQPGPSPWTAGIDVDDFDGSIPRAVKAAGGGSWAPNHKTITRDLVHEAHQLGLQVYVWTPDSRDRMLRLMDMDVDGIITNRPDILKSILGQKAGN